MQWQGHGQSENVEDRRGMKRSGLAIGSFGGIAIVIIGMLFGVDLRPLVAPGGLLAGRMEQAGPPPDDNMAEFAGTMLKFNDDVWTEEFRKNGYGEYQKPTVVLFSRGVDTGCGYAPSAVGPFYCPADRKVYLDPTFFEELQQRLGGSKAAFSQAYVIAHEVGHHVQNLLGYNDKVRQFERSEGKNAGVRLELQADYLAGVWAHQGNRQYKFIESGDIQEAMITAEAIGDDKIQRKTQGQVTPDSFTHGSAAQRKRAFTKGYETGDASPQALDYYFNPRIDPLQL